MTKPWKVKLSSASRPINRCGRYRFRRVSSNLKKELKKITSKRRRKLMKKFDGNLNNSKIFNPYKMDGDWYGKWFYKKN